MKNTTHPTKIRSKFTASDPARLAGRGHHFTTVRARKESTKSHEFVTVSANSKPVAAATPKATASPKPVPAPRPAPRVLASAPKPSAAPGMRMIVRPLASQGSGLLTKAGQARYAARLAQLHGRK